MGKVTVRVAGRAYPLSCRDGEEAHLEALAAHLDAKATDLTGAIGAMSEPRLLLMAGLQLADEVFAHRHDGPATPDADYAALLARVEALAAAVESHGEQRK